MYRTRTCGELNKTFIGEQVILSGWVSKNRSLGGLVFIDLRDRYGITQLVFNEEIKESAKAITKESVIKINGEVIERKSKNPTIPTGNIEILVSKIEILNSSKELPFTIIDETDGSEELRMKYRYLDLRRNPLQKNLALRHRVALDVRNFLSRQNFLEIETPYLIKSTPEGAKDFVVPSSMNEGKHYALPQSPQTMKQLLMVSGYDRYFQIVRCFRDEALRSDRQPEFTQIDCEMSFVTQDDIIAIFSGLIEHLFLNNRIPIELFEVITYADAMKDYGSDKPDTRFGMKLTYFNEDFNEEETPIFEEETIGIVTQQTSLSRKGIKKIEEWVKRPQVGANALHFIKVNEDGTIACSFKKFTTEEKLREIVNKYEVYEGGVIFILSGELKETQERAGQMRLHVAEELGYFQAFKENPIFKPLWVVDFPMFEWNKEEQRYHAMHHPFTAPKDKNYPFPKTALSEAYDLVINGVEIGGGSIRIHDKETQMKVFGHLGFSEEEAKEQFGFLMNAFEYGAPPHGGIAFGLDRLCAMMGNSESIRDFIAFPKNNKGKDTMLNAPSVLKNCLSLENENVEN